MGALEDYFNQIAANKVANNLTLSSMLLNGPSASTLAALQQFGGFNTEPQVVATPMQAQPLQQEPVVYAEPAVPVSAVPLEPQSAIPGLPLRRSQPQPAPMEQGPPAPMATDWVAPVGAPEQYPPETLAEMTPQEQAAARAGYTPPKVLPVYSMIDEAKAASPVKAVVAAPAPAAKRLETTPPVDAAYEEMLKAAPPELRSAFRMIREKNMQNAQQRREALGQMANDIEAERQARLSNIEKSVNELPEHAHQYGKIQHNVKREIALANKKADLAAAELSVQGMDKESAADRLKNARADIEDKYKEDLKPFEETAQAKSAIAVKDKFAEKIVKQENFINQINKMQEYMANGEIEKARQLGASQVAQTMNSLISDNAIQLSEMLIKFPSLLTQDMKNELAGKGILSPSSIIRGLWNSPEEKEQLRAAGEYLKNDKASVKDILKRYTSANPSAFIQTAIDAANANGAALNSFMHENVVRPTSPGFARYTPFKTLDDSVMRRGLAKQPVTETQEATPAAKPGPRKSKSGIPFTILP